VYVYVDGALGQELPFRKCSSIVQSWCDEHVHCCCVRVRVTTSAGVEMATTSNPAYSPIPTQPVFNMSSWYVFYCHTSNLEHKRQTMKYGDGAAVKRGAGIRARRACLWSDKPPGHWRNTWHPAWVLFVHNCACGGHESWRGTC